jgi:predicted RNA-binding Zn-ribbon protein involved in translation (DUF1610 family)
MKINHRCPYCGNDVGAKLIEDSLDILSKTSSFELPCPHCSKMIEVSASLRFDLQMPLQKIPSLGHSGGR